LNAEVSQVKLKQEDDLFLTDDEPPFATEPLDFAQRQIRRRKRKSNKQLNVLKAEFDADPHWPKEKITALADKTGLSEGQIYKWSWDYRKKLKDSGGLMEHSDALTCREMLAPSRQEREEYQLLSDYRRAWSENFNKTHKAGLVMPRTSDILRRWG
jgi:hypothetical protein